MSTALAELQKIFLADMRGLASNVAITHLVQDGGIPPVTGLAIYRNAYIARLREALENDHPVLGQYLGDDLWAQMCEGYIATHPSCVRSLRHFGESLPGYQASVEPFAELPQVAELARLERRLLDCFDAPDSPLADWQQLVGMPEGGWPRLRLRFHPSLHCLRHAWNSIDVWNALKANDTPPPALRDATDWLLWRDADRVTRFRSMAADESIAFQHCVHGGDFAGVCEALLQVHPAESVPVVAIALLRRWCDDGAVTRWLSDTP